jgi:hypothetical protein
MIEINAAAGTNGTDGVQSLRPAPSNNFRDLLDSLGAPAAASRDPNAQPHGRDPLPRFAEPSERPAQPQAPAGRSEAPSRNRGIERPEPPASRGPVSRPDPADAQEEAAPEALAQGIAPAAAKPAVARKAPTAVPASHAPKSVADEVPLPKDQEWQGQVVKMLGLLGISVDAAKLSALAPQEMRELDVALRAGLKGVTEGQPLPQIAQLVGELLPVSLQGHVSPDGPLPQEVVSHELKAIADALPKTPAAPAGDPLGPNRIAPAIDPLKGHKNQEIGRLAEKIVEIVKPQVEELSAAATPKPLAAKPGTALAPDAAGYATPLSELSKEDAPLLPVKPEKEAASIQSGNQDLPKAAPAARKEDPSAFLRLDPNGFQIQRTDLQEADRPEAKVPVFRPSGPAGEILAHQVYDEFQLRPGMDHREMVLKLWPRELGQVSVHIKMAENDRVEAKILVQNENIRQALLEHTPVLRETLAKQGLELGNLSVSVGGGGAQDFAEEREGRGQGRRGRSSHGWENGVLETTAGVAAGTDTGRRNGYNSIDVLT